jgi:hypothetical protein
MQGAAVVGDGCFFFSFWGAKSFQIEIFVKQDEIVANIP